MLLGAGSARIHSPNSAPLLLSCALHLAAHNFCADFYVCHAFYFDFYTSVCRFYTFLASCCQRARTYSLVAPRRAASQCSAELSPCRRLLSFISVEVTLLFVFGFFLAVLLPFISLVFYLFFTFVCCALASALLVVLIYFESARLLDSYYVFPHCCSCFRPFIFYALLLRLCWPSAPR